MVHLFEVYVVIIKEKKIELKLLEVLLITLTNIQTTKRRVKEHAK